MGARQGVLPHTYHFPPKHAMDAEKSPASAHHENPKEGEYEEQLGHLANQEDHESGRWAAIKFVEFR